MYGLRNDIDLEFLKELRLTTVRSTPFQLQVKLGKDVEISAESTVSLDGMPIRFEESETVLHPLIGTRVRAAERRGKGDLVLRFESGGELVFHDDAEQYESYTVTSLHGVIVV